MTMDTKYFEMVKIYACTQKNVTAIANENARKV